MYKIVVSTEMIFSVLWCIDMLGSYDAVLMRVEEASTVHTGMIATGLNSNKIYYSFLFFLLFFKFPVLPPLKSVSVLHVPVEFYVEFDKFFDLKQNLNQKYN